MTRVQRVAVLAALTFPVASLAQAQVTVDMSKVTCAQITGGSAADAIETAIWLSGYYNGKRNSTTVNLNQFRSNAELVIQHCQKNPKKTVMQAVESLRGK
jgi:hypothetical protein